MWMENDKSQNICSQNYVARGGNDFFFSCQEIEQRLPLSKLISGYGTVCDTVLCAYAS